MCCPVSIQQRRQPLADRQNLSRFGCSGGTGKIRGT
jgi:hypothetical protein